MGQAAHLLDDQRGFGIYLHYPLCVRRCGYCDFATVQLDDFPQAVYADALLAEARARWVSYAAWELRTIYVGGGSPSLWPAEQLRRVVDGLFELTGGSREGVEVTVEINPGDLDAAQLAALRAAGVTRLSIGMQSLDDGALKQLTRTHDAARARQAYLDARRAGFDNISCDQICGLPGETAHEHLARLQALIALAPEHVSLYTLTLSRGSELYRRGERQRDDDTLAELLELGRETLEAAGYEQYEVSNYARAGALSHHNSLVWQALPYLGLGASAHSLLVCGDEHLHLANPPFPHYRQASCGGDPPHVDGAALQRSDPQLARLELLLLGLRTTAGVSLARYRARFGSDATADHAEALQRLSAWGLLEQAGGRLRPTRRGIWFADELASQLARA